MSAFEAEVITWDEQSETALKLLRALIDSAPSAGVTVRETPRYTGCAENLVVWGVGRPEFMAAREAHLARGGRVFMWDMGYLGRAKVDGHCRVSINDFHPWRALDRTPNDPSRFEKFGIDLREDADPDGHVILACLGRKSVSAFGLDTWDDRKERELRRRFPDTRVVRREKPRSRYAAVEPIEQLLKGARLLACRHSNCAMDAAIAGVPFECEDGAAYWLAQREFTPENRLDFLHRLCWWQWSCYEMAEAWTFLRSML